MKRVLHATGLMAMMAVLMLSMPSFIQAQIFGIDAEFRPRLEVRDGYRNPIPDGVMPAVFVSQRTRLAMTYQQERLRIRIVPKNVKVWGDDEIANLSGFFGNEASVDLHEAYADLRLRPGTWLAIGRQELSYDNQALLSHRNWNQHGAASDAVVIRHQANKQRLHAGITWNNTHERNFNHYFPTNRLKTMGFVWYNRPFFKGNGQLSVLHVATGVTESDTSNTIRFRQTSGLYALYRKNHTSISGSAYYQYGLNGKGVPVSAFLIDGEASRRFGFMTPGLGIGYLSGNHESFGSMETDRSFYDIYRAKHRYFGFMDMYLNVPAQTFQGGLINLYAYLDFRLRRDITLRNTMHYFSLATTNPLTPEDPFLGLENNLVVRYRFAPWGVLEMGYMVYIPSDSFIDMRGGNADKRPQFFYTMLTLNPNLFSFTPDR